MDAAIVGLVGVVVGGLLSGATSYVTSVRTEQRAAVVTRRAAVRLIAEELRRAATALDMMRQAVSEQIADEEAADSWETRRHVIERRSQPSQLLELQLSSGALPEISSAVWDEQQRQLAGTLEDPQWATVALAYDAITSGRIPAVDGRLRRLHVLPDDPPISVEGELSRAIEKIEFARAELSKVSSK